MKKVYLLFWILILPVGLFAQEFTDTNTDVINAYFQNSSNEISSKKATPVSDNQQSGVLVVQNGDFNETYIQSVQSSDNQIVTQNGTKNSYEFYNYTGNTNSKIIINQEGVMNSLQIYGENSLMENVMINQKSNFKTLIIKNFNN